MIRALDIFPITIYQTKIDQNEFLKQELIPKITEVLPDLKIPKGWATDNLKTSFDGEPEGKEVLDQYDGLLKSLYDREIEKFFDREASWDYGDDIWYNYYQDGSYQELHDHISHPMTIHHFSCIHYLSYEKGVHTPAEFRDPVGQLRQHSLTLDSEYVSDYYTPNWVEEGTLIMFPCYLEHRVIPQRVLDIPRITLSFNLEVTSYDSSR